MDISSDLIYWYQQNHRKLPWRETKDPYLIWLSEVILQQTRVDQGLPYYTRFSECYPNVEALAAAEEGQALKLWQGLGYYSRARNLLKTARDIVDKHQGNFPPDYNKLLQLKGIGEYTAAAIASFAFDLPYPVVDGNVFRVLARIFGIDSPVPASRKVFYTIADNLMDKMRPALFNQAIMEFGAMHCLPKKPLCGQCPFSGGCYAFSKNETENYPVKQSKPKKKKRYISYYHLEDNGKTLLNKRTEKDIWQNLYEFPSIEFPNQVNEQDCLDAFAHKYNIKDIAVIQDPIQVRHLLSHQNIHAFIFRIKTDSYKNLSKHFEVVPHKRLKQYAVHRIIEKYLDSTYKKTK